VLFALLSPPLFDFASALAPGTTYLDKRVPDWIQWAVVYLTAAADKLALPFLYLGLLRPESEEALHD